MGKSQLNGPGTYNKITFTGLEGKIFLESDKRA